MFKLTDGQVVDLLKSERRWNIARRAFSDALARIAARGSLAPLELRRQEFLAVADIARALGVMLPEVRDIGPLEAPAPLPAPGVPPPSGPAPLGPENVG